MASWRRRWAALAAAALSATAALAAMELRSDEELVLEGPRDDLLFATGRRIELKVSSSDDVYLAGRTITVDGARADRLTIGGETILLSDFEAGDAVLGGRQIEMLDGVVTDDVIAGGSSVTLGAGADIRGSALLSGGEVIVEAPVGGELRAAGRRVRINGTVGGNVELAGREVIVGPKAQIAGRLTHRAHEVEIDPAARIAGGVTALEPEDRDGVEHAVGVAAAFSLAFLIGIVALIMLIAGLLPALMRASAERIRERPWATLGVGALIAFGAPVLIALLGVSIVGIPIALVLLALLAVLGPVAIAASAYVLGRQASGVGRRHALQDEPGFGARIGWTALALLALLIVGVVPILGGLVWLAAYLFGLGAVALLIARALARGRAPAAV